MTKVSGVVVVDGITKTRLEWCEYLGITSSLLSQRMRQHSISLEDAIRMGGRKGSVEKRAKAAKAAAFEAIPLPDEPLRQCANDPDSYVTADGRVWNHRHKRWMSTSVHAPNRANTNRRYARVRVGRLARYVQQVVADAWVENPENLPWVLHKDDDTLNNHKDNLVWSSVKGVFDFRREVQGG